MNTRNVKFLAVLAVLAMAFAAFAVIVPTDDSDATDNAYISEPTTKITVDGELKSGSTTIADNKKYLVTENVEITTIAGTNGITIYILDGKTLTLKGGSDTTTGVFTIKVAKAGSTLADGVTYLTNEGDGSLQTDATLQVVSDASTYSLKITATYGAAGSAATTEAVAVPGTASSFSIEGSAKTITFAKCATAGVSGNACIINADTTTKAAITGVADLTYGACFNDNSETTFTYYKAGAISSAIEMAPNDVVSVKNATVSIASKVTTDVVSGISFKEVESTTPITATAANETALVEISGGVATAKGEIAITAGNAVIADDLVCGNIVLTGYALANPYKEADVPMYPTYTDLDLKSTAYDGHPTLYICGKISQADVTLTASITAGDRYIATGIYYIYFTGNSNVTIDNTAITAGAVIGHKFTASIEGKAAYGWGYEVVDSTDSTGSSTAIMSSYPDIDGAPTGASGEFIVKTDMQIENATIKTGSTLTVAEGATVKVIDSTTTTPKAGFILESGSEVVIDGTLDAKGVNINVMAIAGKDAPEIALGANAVFNHGAVAAGIDVESEAADNPDNTPIWGPWTTPLKIDKTFYLSDDLIIDEGAEFTIVSGGLLQLNGYNLLLKGSLEIKTGGAISGIGFNKTAGGEGIVITKTGGLENVGVIGLGGAAVTISPFTSETETAYGGSVSMQNVTGVEISYGKYANPEFATVDGFENVLGGHTYYMTVSGEANKFTGTGSISTYKLELGQNTILGAIDVATGVQLITATNGNLVAKNSYLDIAGDVSGKLWMESGSTLDLSDGKVTGTVELYGYTGAFKTGQEPACVQSALAITELDIKDSQGIVIELEKSSYSKSGSSYIDYSFDISGKLVQVSKKAEDNLITVKEKQAATGTTGYVPYTGIYVKGLLELAPTMNSTSVYAIKSVATGGEKISITVVGTVSSTTSGLISFDNANKLYSEYAIKESATKTVYYQTSFETALDVIDDTVDGIKVYGTFDVPASFIQESKKGIVLDSTAVITIPSTISVTIAKGSSMTGAVYSVEGRLTKIDGADMTTPIKYTVMTKNDNNDITYSGLQPAIDDAKAGDVIVLKADASASSLTIPEGVTLDSNNNAITITKGDLIVNGKLLAEDLTVKGKLIVNGEMESDGTVAITGITTVSGTADLTAAAPTFSDKVTSTGALLLSDGVATTNFNGALVSNGTDMVLTTLPGAIVIALVAEENAITVYGTYSDSETIILPDGMTLTIAADAKATLGTIEISDATVVATGSLTATLTGFAGTDAEETSMEFVEAKFTAVSDLSALNTSGANEYKFVLNTLSAGSVEILEGTVTSSATNTVAADQTFTVVSDAVYKAIGGELGGPGSVDIYGYLNVTDNFALSSTESTIAGDVNVAKGKTFTINGTSSVTGTITVLGTLDIDGTVTVLGSIDATADDALVDMDGKLNIGESAFASSAGASVTGNIDLEAGKFIQVFPGSTFSSDDLVYTEYVVNGIEYKTVYVSGTVKLSATISEKEIAVTGYDMTGFGTITNWKDSEGNNMTDVNVGKASTIFFDGTALKVTVLPSVGVGMTLYIDGVSYTSGSQKAFSIGTHQVKVTINPGYKGSFDITFNGKPVAGETFNLTADMTSEEYVVLTVTGQIEVDPGYTPEPVQEQDNTVTLILLVVLVVLVAAMAIITAMKLTRS